MKGLLEIKKASVVYLEGTPFVTRALSSVSLEIRPGEILGLIGSTGSGKSTLVQAMNGLVPLTEGEVVYPEDYEADRLFERIGLVFQQPEDQLFERTVGEDVGFGPSQLGLGDDEIRRRVERALEAVGLAAPDYVGRNPLELSGGEKRRVAIAGILSMEPDLLVLDEPTAGLDRAGRDKLLRSIRRLHGERNLTLLMISHDMELLSELAERLVILHKGRLVCDGSPREVFSNRKALEEAGLRPPAPVELLHRLADAGVEVDCGSYDVRSVTEAVSRALEKGRSALRADGGGGRDDSGRGSRRRKRRKSGRRGSRGA